MEFNGAKILSFCSYMNMNIKDFDPNTQCRGISMSHYLYFYLPSLKGDLCLQSSRMGAPL